MTIFASVLNTKEAKSGKNLTKVVENPVANALQLKLNPGFKENNTVVSIYNMAGQQSLKADYSKNINVTGIPAGLYVAVISDGIITERVKFIKK